jgi:glycosyltransferase involved in cell wall biosynthesis
MRPAISVITVVKDDVAGLKATAASILSQKFLAFEWLIIDGYSSDGSWQYAQELQLLPFVTSAQCPPTGIYGAMNFGAKESNASWLWFINAGDELLTDETLNKIALVANSNTQASIIATPIVYLTPTNHFFSLSIPKIMKTKLGDYAIFHHQGCLLNRSIFDKTGGFDEMLKLAADGKLLDSMISIASPVIVPIITVGFEMGGATSKNFWRSLTEIRLYRPESFTTKKMLIYQLKEMSRAIFLKCLGTPVGRFYLNSYVVYRESCIISDAKRMGLDLPKKREFRD